MFDCRYFFVLLPCIAACSCSAPGGGAPSNDAASYDPVDGATAVSNTTDPLTVLIPGGEVGIGFDDLRYSAALHRVLVPGGRAGVVALVNPDSGGVETIGGFSTEATFGGGHDFGVTSVDEGRGFLFATDRTSGKLHVIDPRAKQIVSSAVLGAGADYVRYVAATDELWVTEPNADRIEIFSLSADSIPVLTSVATVAVRNGPESLVVDGKRGRAYTHRWDTSTVAIDVRTRGVVAEWPNGCRASRGIDLDVARGHLFAACSEGKVSVLDVDHGGAMVGSTVHGSGFDVIGYDPTNEHLYAAGSGCKCLSIFGVGGDTGVTLVSEKPAAPGTHCSVADDVGHAWFCDPRNGAIVRITDAM